MRGKIEWGVTFSRKPEKRLRERGKIWKGKKWEERLRKIERVGLAVRFSRKRLRERGKSWKGKKWEERLRE